MTLFGSSVKANPGEDWPAAYKRVSAQFGGYLPVVRVFRNKLPAANHPMILAIPPETRIVMSFRDMSTIDGWLQSIKSSKRRYDVVYWHEPEDNVASGELTASQHCDNTRTLRRKVDAAGLNDIVRVGIILMSYTLTKASKRNWRNYYPGDGVLDFIGFDNYAGEDGRGVCRPAAEVAKELGIPYGIGETGKRITEMGEEALAKWLVSVATYAQRPDPGLPAADWVCYWNGADRADEDFRMDDRPKAIAEWTRVIKEPGSVLPPVVEPPPPATQIWSLVTAWRNDRTGELLQVPTTPPADLVVSSPTRRT